MLRMENVSLRAGDFQVKDVCRHVSPGEYFVIMGPTGSGKSLLAKCICGLARPARGRIHISGRDVTDMEPRLRHIGYLPQECALFPHMDTARNITFARRVRHKPHAAALKDVRAVTEMLGLGALLHRRTYTLSGGERQKVALARALAGEPELLVLDEPLSALDEPTRREISAELLRVQRELRLTAVHICHNTEEAETIADRIGIMYQGKLLQTGTMDELRAGPVDAAVADLLNVSNPAS